MVLFPFDMSIYIYPLPFPNEILRIICDFDPTYKRFALTNVHKELLYGKQIYKLKDFLFLLFCFFLMRLQS